MCQKPHRPGVGQIGQKFENTVDAGRSLPFSGHGIIATTRDDEAADFISRTLVPMRIAKIADRQGFRLDMNGRRLKRLFVAFNQFAVDTLIDPRSVEDTVIVGVGYDHRRPSYFKFDEARVQVSPTTAVVMSPTRRVQIDRPRQSGMLGITVSASILSDRLQKFAGKRIGGPMVFDPSVDLTRGPGRLLCETILAIKSEIEGQEAGAENSLRLSILEDALISVLLNLPGNHSRQLEDEARPSAAPWVVRRAEEYMAARIAEPISLADLAAACGCSRSSLTQAFRSSRGYTAMAFLASRRLETAHERLKREPATTATEIALDCGFGNQGRFAKAYRKRFGEAPSATHARCHGLMRQ
jgi:AraC-like DNA-binding protein